MSSSNHPDFAMNCSACGGPNPSAATFCQYCGSPVTTPTGAPLPSSTPPPPPQTGGFPQGYEAPPQPPPRRRSLGRTVLLVLVVFVAAILVVGAVAYLVLPTPANVTVTQVDFSSADNACGVDGATSDGFNAGTSEAVSMTFYVTGNTTTSGTSACRIQSITTPTAGFTVSGADTPLSIAANQTGTLSFNVDTPGSGYSGVLTFVIT